VDTINGWEQDYMLLGRKKERKMPAKGSAEFQKVNNFQAGHMMHSALKSSSLWCCSLSHHYFCIAEIGMPKWDHFLIPLVKHILSVIGNFLPDRF
jgi:hypothetical protein